MTGEPRTSHGVRFELAARLGRTPAKYECDVDDRFFFKVSKKSPKPAPKEGSKRVPERAAVKS